MSAQRYSVIFFILYLENLKRGHVTIIAPFWNSLSCIPVRHWSVVTLFTRFDYYAVRADGWSYTIVTCRLNVQSDFGPTIKTICAYSIPSRVPKIFYASAVADAVGVVFGWSVTVRACVLGALGGSVLNWLAFSFWFDGLSVLMCLCRA